MSFPSMQLLAVPATVMSITTGDETLVHAVPGFTAYTGGGATSLDGQPTAGILSPGAVMEVNDPSLGIRTYVLYAGTTATDTTSWTVVRPADFNASTNAVVWKLRA